MKGLEKYPYLVRRFLLIGGTPLLVCIILVNAIFNAIKKFVEAFIFDLKVLGNLYSNFWPKKLWFKPTIVKTVNHDSIWE